MMGALSRLIKPGNQNLDLLMTHSLGLVGSINGGLIASVLGTGDIWELNSSVSDLAPNLQQQRAAVGSRRPPVQGRRPAGTSPVGASRTVTLVPSCGPALSAQMLPPCASTSALVMLSPIPEPPLVRSLAVSAR